MPLFSPRSGDRGRTVGQIVQRELGDTITGSTISEWEEVVLNSMGAGQVKAVVALLKEKTHYVWSTKPPASSHSEEEQNSAYAEMQPVFGWKLAPCMERARKWIARQGLSFTMVFANASPAKKLPNRGLLIIFWQPLETSPLEKSLLDRWLKQHIPKVKTRQKKKGMIRKRLLRGMVECGQLVVTVAIFYENDDYFTRETAYVDESKAKLSCKGRCRDFLTNNLLDPEVLGYKNMYLSESVSKMIDVVEEEDLDWFLAFNVRYKKVLTNGQSNLDKLIAMYKAINETIPTDEDIEDLRATLEENDGGDALTVSVSPWAYFCATRRTN